MTDNDISGKPAPDGDSAIRAYVEAYQGNTYRAVYTVHYARTVYVLHCFQKNSNHGIATPKRHIDLIKTRLVIAAAMERRRHP